jgi:hypothetical protein
MGLLMHDYYPEGWEHATSEEKERNRALYEQNLIVDLMDVNKHKSSHKRERIYGTDFFWTLKVMKDGLLHIKHRREIDGSLATAHYPWSNIEYVDVSKGPFLAKLVNVGGETTLLPSIHPEDLTPLREKWPIYVARGDIPLSVGFISGGANTASAASPPEVRGERKRAKNAWALLVILLAVVAGVPFFQGGGSLAASALPGLANIAPDAVNLAIQNNPQRPTVTTVTRLELIGMAAAVNKTPTAALTAFGFQQNNAASLWFIPLYWLETLASRDWQVKTLADLIAEKVNQPSAPH